MPRVPGYNYLGPGNDAVNSGDPVNDTDAIAKLHDLRYLLSSNKSDIRDADRKAIVDFWDDFIRTRRIGDAIGILGLAAKYLGESVVGVQYGFDMGKFKKNITQNQYVYSVIQKAKAEYWRTLPSNRYNSYNDFIKSDEARLWETKYRYENITNIISSYQSEYLAPPKVPDTEPQAGPSKRPADSGPRPHDAEPSTSTDKRPRTEQDPQDLNSTLEGALSPNTYNNLLADIAEDSASLPSAGANSQGMEVDATPIQSGSGRGPNTGARSGASVLSGGTGGGGNGSTWIKRSTPVSGTTLKFKKTRILYSYAYAVKNIQAGSPDYIEQVTTSLGLLPVDYLPFYLSHSEWTSLPPESVVDFVSCKVTPLGTRTAFDTGTTLSGTATSEYVPIGLVSEGMNIHFYGRNRLYTATADEPMCPTGVEEIKKNEMTKRWYIHVDSNAMCYPVPITEYYVHEWNRNANPQEAALPEYQVHNAGVPRMDEKVDQFLINHAIGQPIYHYMYKPRYGHIKASKSHYVPWNRRGFKVETNTMEAKNMKLQFFENSDKTPSLGRVGLEEQKRAFQIINRISDSYERQIENYGMYSINGGASSFIAQPQLHVGIVATPQLKPTNPTISYLNSSAYWKVEVEMDVKVGFHSAFTYGEQISWPREVHFFENAGHMYTDGNTLFGQTDSGAGLLSPGTKRPLIAEPLRRRKKAKSLSLDDLVIESE